VASSARRPNVFDLLAFALLVAIGVAGRWGQPEWCFTPTSAAAMFAGFYFSRLAVAVLVPLAILALSDLALPPYNSILVMVATYAVMTVPVLFGRLLRGEYSTWGLAGRWLLCGLAPATLFFIVSNFAVWAFQSDYEKSLAGLVQCYTAAVPFYRWMLTGDVFYAAVLFACWALAGVTFTAKQPSLERVREELTRRD
jgi:hypothetical protein